MAYAQMGEAAQNVTNGALYALTPQAYSRRQPDIIPGANAVTLQPGVYMVSYTVCADGSTPGDYRVIPMLNGVALMLYSAAGTSIASEQTGISETFIINNTAISSFQLQASLSVASMTQSVSVSIVKIA